MRCCNCEGKAELNIDGTGMCLPCFYSKFRLDKFKHDTVITVINQDTVLSKFLEEVIGE